MTFTLTETQQMVRETARKFAREHLAPGAIHRDEYEEFPAEAIRALAGLGFMGMMVPEQWGGIGMDTVSYILAMEEVARVDASVAVIMSVHNSLACGGLYSTGTEEQKNRYLRDLAAGRLLGAFALSEPEAGSDAANQHSTAVRDGNCYVLNGVKSWTTSGSNADLLIVMAANDRSKGTKGISAFLVEKGTPGLSVAKREKKMGIRSSDTVALAFVDCRIPIANRLGEEGEGFKFAMKTLEAGRVGIAAQAVGLAQASLDASLKYARERKAFGKTLGELQAIQLKLAEMATGVDAARLLMMRAACLKDQGRSFGTEASMAKLFASRTAVMNSLEAIQIHGGYGYVQEYQVERFLRDAKVTEIYEGTSEIQKLIIARSLLK
jgi:alkylation response protein AidB-like acyl-CoA dehydrogenase